MSTDKQYPRSIRSFVRRRGRMTDAQKNAIQLYWPSYGLEFQQNGLELPAGFDALKLEIGIGNGDALLHMAEADRSSLYIGVEVHTPGVGRCLNRIHQMALANVRLVMHDAVEVLEYMITPGTLDRILLFFPDPWHKKRHHKRRIVNQHFRDLVYRDLKPGASIHVATDWQDYAESIAAQFLADARFSNEGDDSGYAERPAYRGQTRFEQRGLRLGHGVCDLVFTKK
ncbi:MAG: tRNA (guanosine(46)-N7)-methyltransferase TrmB [Gammaproteobacteria bacterium]|nr:tRNA (guanosine(46)-N7)-methyltransferase TrmB [Gammaproteobacteria bacterium]MDH3857951.1 tRNA (guanosine(46)-N7)-methyltransferase TrmB [Gammaproteobacteria bacterium]